MNRFRSPSLLTVIYVLIGIFVASDRNYFKGIDQIDQVISAILAILLWPLVLLDVNLRVNF